jgi:hypothetical protein
MYFILALSQSEFPINNCNNVNFIYTFFYLFKLHILAMVLKGNTEATMTYQGQNQALSNAKYH